MADFVKAGQFTTPFGRNQFLRSTKGMRGKPYTVARDTIPTETIDGNPGQRQLQPGTVMAKITSGPNIDKIGPFQAGGTAEQQTITPSGTWTSTGGTYKVGVTGSTDAVNVAPSTTGSQLATALAALPSLSGFQVSGSGGPLTSGVITITFTGNDVDADAPTLTFDHTNVTGGTSPNAAVATSVSDVAGASDGRQTLANIVGLNGDFVPWQLIERDVDVNVLHNCDAKQNWCLELDAAGNRIMLSNTTAAAMQRGGAAGKSIDINWS